MPPDKYGDALKLAQITFYVVGAIVAILTYRAAKRGLLNTVNTEYQKRVMDRLHKLSDDLYSEFDESSETYWAKSRPVHDAVEHINEVFENRRDEIISSKKYYYGTPVTKDVQQLRRMLSPVVSDPFIPDNVRVAVVDLLQGRISVLSNLYGTEFDRYANNLAKGKHEPVTDLDGVNNIHNKLVEQVNAQGCGVPQIEKEVHGIRRLIQQYFDSFNPHRRWWNQK